jgi:hypothetical protein
LTLRHLVNGRLAFGEVTELSVDTRARRVHARLTLRGEAEPIDVAVRRYEVERAGDDSFLTIADAVASRAWLTVVLRQFVVNRRFFLPRNAAAVLRFVL